MIKRNNDKNHDNDGDGDNDNNEDNIATENTFFRASVIFTSVFTRLKK